MKKKIFSWLLRLLFVLLFSVAGYFGFWLWGQYGHSFSGEVNAAMIGGVIAIVTMAISSMMTYYATKRSERITVRDEMFRKRLEVYSTIHGILMSMLQASINYFRKNREEEKENIEKYVSEFATYYDQNTFYLSKEVRRLCHTTKYFLIALVEFLNDKDVNWIEHFLKEETFIEHAKQVKSWGITDYSEFQRDLLTSVSMIVAVQEYCFPVIYQMNEELGLPIVEKEIQRLNEGE